MADQLLDLTAFAPSSEPVLDLEQFAPPKPAPAKKPGILIPSVKRTAGQMVGATGVALEDLGLKTRLPEVGEAIVEANPAQIQKPSDILEKPGTFLGESVSEMLPQLGAFAAGAWGGAKVGGRLGAFLGPKGAVAGAGIGGLVGGLAPIFTQEYGEIRETQKKEGAENVPKALLGATAATALERLGAEKLVGRIVKGGGMELIKEGVSRPLHMLKRGAIGALVEGPGTEFPQTAIERLAGGAPLANEEAMADYIISSAKGAAGGGIVTGALSGLARREQPPMEAPSEVAPAAEVAPAGPAEPLGLAEFIRANRASDATGPLTAAEVKAARPDYEAYKQAFINEQFGVEALTPEQRNQILINQTPLEVPAPAVEPAPEAPTAFQRFPAAQAKIVVAPDQLQVEDISPTTRAVTQELRVSGPKLGVYMLEALDGEPVAGPFYSREEATRAALPRPAVASEKTGQAEPVVLGEQPAPVPAAPIITPQEAEFLRIAETEAAAPVAAEVQSDPATKVALLKRQRGELLTNREAKLVRDYEKAAPAIETPAVQTQPRFRGRQFGSAERRENFVNAYSRAVDSALADLVAQGVAISPNKLKRASSVLKRSAEAAVAAKDDAAGAAILDAEMGKALRGIIPKAEIETFRQKLADAAQAAMPETLMSKAAASAEWTPARVDKLLRIYAYGMDKEKTKAYAVYMSPQQFLDLTATPEQQQRIRAEAGELRATDLAAEEQELFLYVSPTQQAPNVLQVTDHEGRHRAAALAAAGVAEMPVVLNMREGARRSRISDAQLIPQPSTKSTEQVAVGSATPLSYANAAELKAQRPDAAVTFSRAAVDAAIIAKSDEIYNTIAGMIGTPKDLLVEAAPRVPGGAGMIQFGQLRDVITVSVQAVDVGSVASHEGFHYLDKRVLNGPERRVVRQAFASGSRLHRMLVAKAAAYDAANGTDITSEIRAIPAEARAYGFEFWRRGELDAQGMIAKVFQKLARVMERIRNYIDGLGFTSYEDLFAMIRRGEYAKRDLSGIREFEREVMRSRAQREASEKAFYSALAEAVADIRKVAGKDGMIAPAQAKTWLAARQKEGRFKAAELEAVGLAEWLDLQQGKVSVDDIETFVREHGVQVEETMLGAETDADLSDAEEAEYIELHRRRAELAADERARLDELHRRGNYRPAVKFGPNTHPTLSLPGGENSRELLLRLPRTAEKQHRFQVFGAFPMDFATREAAEQYMAHIQAQPELRADLAKYPPSIEPVETDASRAKEFRSGHFDQPNIVVHVRFNERTDADGKRVLVLEELQSDWAQKGRKGGFDIEPTVSRLANGKWQIQRGVERTELPPGRFKSVEEAQAWATENYRGRGEIPSAPFVTDTKAWVALAMKRMIRYAAENGFDRVAWTTGEQQAARYDLSMYIDRIEYMNNDGNKAYILAFDDSGEAVINETITHEKLAGYFGKGIAEKIINGGKEGRIEDADLKVGGEWTQAFYGGVDQKVRMPDGSIALDKNGKERIAIVPQVANELLKKFGGGKVGEVRLTRPTDKLRESEFKYAGPGKTVDDLRPLVDAGNYAVPAQIQRQLLDVINAINTGVPFERAMVAHGSVAAARAVGGDLVDVSPQMRQMVQPGFDITPALRGEAMAGLPLFSKAATESIQDIGRRMSEGDLQREQVNAHLAAQLDRPDMRDMTERLAERAGFELSAIANSIRRGYHAFIGSGENRARASAGYRSVFNVMTHYMQRKSLIFERAIAKDLSTWVKGATKQDKVAVSRAMLAATVGSYSHDMPEYQALRNSLTTEQRAMMDQAWAMIGKMLDSEFEADARKYRKLFADDAKFEEWFANRKAQVDQLKKQSYFPERRYGDHFVHAYVEAPDGKKITMYYEQYEREAGATSAKAELEKIFGAEGLKVEYGFKHKAEYDGSLSIGQFLDLAQRHGISLTQPEKERLGKALIAADSTRRNRVFRRQNVAGYSQDGMRVLAEFAVSMANKVAYSEMGDALQDALQGKQVDVAFTRDGTVTINTQEGTNVWEQDGPDAGFFRNLADEKVGFVMSPESRSTVSNKLRAMATVYFLGGSVAAAGINLSSLPMITLPWLTQHTNPANAAAKLLDGMRLAGKHFKEIRDLPTLLGSAPIEGVDEVEGLRHALQIAAQDGSLFDTEIYQFMGLSRGQEYSLSGRTQEAVKLWMTPFRIAEQYNRVSAFIAAYKVAKGNNLANEAAFAQAQEAVYGTQFRYDEANRPALADSGVGSLFFVFKSFPIFMMETMTFLAKENPRSAVFMLGMLVLMAGVEGLPFAEDLEDLIDVLAQRLFGEPFNSKRWLRNTLKNASEAVVGADLSGVLMHGVANSLTGLNFASRVGAGNLVPGTRIGAADTDYRRAMEEILGPVGSMVSGVVAGGDALSKGDFMTAAKKGLPLAAKNAVKGWEQFEKGYATDAGGRKLVDVGSWEALWQSLGFSSSALAQVYESDSIDRRTSAFYTEIKGQFTKEMVAAIRDGDREAANEVGQAVMAWNQAHPDMPIAMSPASIRRQVALAGMPLNQRTLLTMPRYLRGQSEAAIGLATE